MSSSARRGPCAGWCGPRASSGWPGRTWPARSTSRATSSTTLDALSSARPAVAGATFPGPPPGSWLALRAHRRARWARSAARPPRPPEEFRRHRRRAGGTAAAGTPRAVAHHYDVGNDFYALVLGPDDGLLLRRLGPTRAPAWTPPRRPSSTSSAASSGLRAGHAAARRRLRLGQPGAARRRGSYGVEVVGITLSAEQADAGPQAGRRGRARPTAIDIRVQDYREVDDGPFDAISSIGMAEHVGRAQHARRTWPRLHGLLRPGGRLLNHAIAWAAGDDHLGATTRFIARYVFPDGELISLGRHGRRAGGRRPRGRSTSRRCAGTTR